MHCTTCMCESIVVSSPSSSCGWFLNGVKLNMQNFGTVLGRVHFCEKKGPQCDLCNSSYTALRIANRTATATMTLSGILCQASVDALNIAHPLLQI